MRRPTIISSVMLTLGVFLGISGAVRGDSLSAWGNDCCGQLSGLPGEANFIDIVAGKEHGLGLTSGGTVVSWGQNSTGQSTVPQDLGVCTAIGAGWEHSLVVKANGSLDAWGSNYKGQCDVPAGTDYLAVDGGEYYSVAIKTDRSLVAWGQDTYGQVSSVPSGTGFVEIAAGMSHCLARRSDGSVVAWGRSYENQCDVPSGTYIGIAAGKDCSFGIKSDGSIIHWGSDPWSYGLDEVPAGNDFVAISSRYTHGLAMRSNGSVVGWGAGSGIDHPHYGQDTAPAGTDYTAIAAGGYWSLAMVQPPEPVTWHVDGDKASSGDGTSWDEAFTSISEAIGAATTTNKEIWVKRGTYVLSSPINVNKAVEMYGGFWGTETDRAARDWEVNESIIDGDNIVLHCLYVTAHAKIDGFTITGGNAVGQVPEDEGGGLYINNCDPNIVNCTFEGNHAEYRGGGVYAQFSGGSFSNCTFISNTAGSQGGGMYNYQSDLTIRNCRFVGNQGLPGSNTSGGAIYNHTCAPTITDCTFTANRATNGAGIYTGGGYIGNCTFADCNSMTNRGGGIYGGSESLVVLNCLFSGNEVTWDGGAMHLGKGNVVNCIMYNNHSKVYGGALYIADNADPNITNCTICWNSADNTGGAVYNSWALPTFTNCLIGENSAPTGSQIYNYYGTSQARVNYCDVEGGYSGSGGNNIDIDPEFVDPCNGDLRLSAGSPCIDAGDNFAPGISVGDYLGNERLFDGDANGTVIVDLGAYEFQGEQETFLVSEDFEDGDYDGWVVVDEGGLYAPSDWQVSGGVMIQNSNIFGGDGTAIDMPGTYAFYSNGMSWTDYTFSVTLRSDDDDGIGLMFRYQDADNYYRFGWNRQRGFRRLEKKVNGVFTLLAEDSVAYVAGETYEVKIVACGAAILALVDDTTVLRARDSSLESGTVALYTWGNAGSYFDDVTVKEIEQSDLVEDFEDGDYEGWEVVDEGGLHAPSDWQVSEGVMVQNSNIYGGDGTTIDMPGTYAFYKDGCCWVDYVLRLSIKSDDDDGIGLMFRYQDEDNYYRFSWHSQRSYCRLTKKQNGLFSVLAEDSVPYTTGQTYNVEVLACGPTIQVLIEDELALWAYDFGIGFGSIALYSWGNTGAYFDDISVYRIAESALTDPSGDGETGLSDVALLVDYWLADDCSAANDWCGGADVIRDGRVDLADYCILADSWLWLP